MNHFLKRAIACFLSLCLVWCCGPATALAAGSAQRAALPPRNAPPPLLIAPTLPGQPLAYTMALPLATTIRQDRMAAPSAPSAAAALSHAAGVLGSTSLREREAGSAETAQTLSADIFAPILGTKRAASVDLQPSVEGPADQFAAASPLPLQGSAKQRGAPAGAPVPEPSRKIIRTLAAARAVSNAAYMLQAISFSVLSLTVLGPPGFAVVGIVTAVSGIVMGLAQGPLVDRLSPRRVLTLGSAGVGLVSAAMAAGCAAGFAWGLTSLSLASALVSGLMQAVVVAEGTLTVQALEGDGKKIQRSFGIYDLIFSGLGVAASLAGGIAAQAFGPAGIFAVFAAAQATAAALYMRGLPQPEPAEKQTAAPFTPLADVVESFKTAARSPYLLALLAVPMAAFFVVFPLQMTLIPVLATQYLGGSERLLGIMNAAVYAGILAASLFNVSLSSRFSDRRLLILGALAFPCLGLLMAAPHSVPVLLAGLGLIFALHNVGFNVLRALYTAEVQKAHPQQLGKLMSLYTLLLGAAAMLGTWLLQWLFAGSSYPALLYRLAVPYALATALYLFSPQLLGWAQERSAPAPVPVSISATALSAARVAHDDPLRALYQKAAHGFPENLKGLDSMQRARLWRAVFAHPVAGLDDPSKMEKYDPKGFIGFCFGRAMAAHLLARRMGLAEDSVRKLFIVGDMRQGPKPEWRFHVTTLVKDSAGRWHAIDPIFREEGPLPVEAWIAKVRGIWDKPGKTRVYLTPASTVIPDLSVAAASPQQETGTRIIELNFDPSQKPGFSPIADWGASVYAVDPRTVPDYFNDAENAKSPFDFKGVDINGERIGYNGYFEDLLRSLTGPQQPPPARALARVQSLSKDVDAEIPVERMPLGLNVGLLRSRP